MDLIPSLENYAESIGLPKDQFSRITFEQAAIIAEANQSMREHLSNWQKAASHDAETRIPLTLYEIDLDADTFGRLILQQAGGGDIEKKLMPARTNNMLIRTICDGMIEARIGIDNFKQDGSHYSHWTERVATYHDILLDHPESPHLFVVPPLNRERANNPDASFFISDGNHRALAAGVYHFVSGRPLPKLKAIIAWCDRDTLQTQFEIKV